MTLIIVITLLNLAILLGVAGFLYKINVDLKNFEKNTKDQIRSYGKRNEADLKTCKDEISSIKNDIKELTKIEEME